MGKKRNAKYKVTGVDRSGRRFPAIYTDNSIHARSVNLYQGTIWQFDGEKYRVMFRVYN